MEEGNKIPWEFLIFLLLMGMIFGAIQMAYNSALEYRDMRRTCENYDLLPLKDGCVCPDIRQETGGFQRIGTLPLPPNTTS